MDVGLRGSARFFLLHAPLVDVGGVAYFLLEGASGACKSDDSFTEAAAAYAELWTVFVALG